MSFNDDPLAAGLPKEGEDSMAEILGGFPRHLTTKLIEQGAEHESWRQVAGVWVLAAALTLFALALPAAPEAWAATFARPAAALGLNDWPGQAGRLQYALESRFGAHVAEQLRLLVSAIAYGLCLPSAFAITRRFGAGFGPRLAVTFTVLLSAGAWIAGTDPAGSSVALLFALELFRRTWNGAPGLRLRALIVLPLYAFLVPAIDWFLPAILLASLDGSVEGRSTRRRAVVIGLVGVVVLAVLVLGWWLRVSALDASLRTTLDLSQLSTNDPLGLGGRGIGEALLGFAGARLAWAGGIAVGLGISALGLGALLFLRRDEAEERPPRWLLLWCLAPLVAGITCPPELASFSALLLLPVALVGLMDLVARLDEGPGRGLAIGLPVAQAALLVGLVTFAGSDRPLRQWQEEAMRSLEPRDLVVSADAVHREQLVRRWNLDVVAARPYGLTPGVEDAVERAWAAGRRVAVDVGSFREGVGAALAAELTVRGEVLALAGYDADGSDRD